MMIRLLEGLVLRSSRLVHCGACVRCLAGCNSGAGHIAKHAHLPGHS
jgi:hypothetical protein